VQTAAVWKRNNNNNNKSAADCLLFCGKHHLLSTFAVNQAQHNTGQEDSSPSGAIRSESAIDQQREQQRQKVSFSSRTV
jgi:hypothetical protein